ncbi:MAG: signal recognition particle protein [Mycoplasmataceae bacterium]|nr:signal recognition particle protein [Mycoplasmataceae bacterium]
MLKALISSLVAKHFKKKLDSWTIHEEDVTEVLRQIRITLLDADVNLLVVKDFIKSIRQEAVGKTIDPGQDPQQVLLSIIKNQLVNILGKQQKTIDTNAKELRIMLVGLQGSGKTTTCAKLAHYLHKEHKYEPLLVGIDVYRPAAIEQLHTLANDNHFAFFAKGTQDPTKTASEAIVAASEKNNNLIIFDTAGRLQTNKELMDELVRIRNAVKPDEILLVVDAMSGQDVINIAKEFNDTLGLTGFIITKMDSDARAGAALSLTHLLDVPVKFTGVGERVTELDLFYPDRIADRILGLGDVLTLSEQAAKVVDESATKKTFAKMLSGKMDLDDLLMQLEQINKMGSLSSLMKKMPNMPNIGEDTISHAENKIYIWKILMSSMTRQERKNPSLLKKEASRRLRITNGSGRNPDELNKMLAEWEKAKKKMDEMGKMIKNNKNPFSQFM